MFDCNIWNHLSKYKQMINTKYNYLKPFNCVQIIVILGCKQISYDSLKNSITYKLLTYKSYE